VEHRPAGPEGRGGKLPGELKRRLVLRHGCLEPIAALLRLRVIHECVLGLFQRVQNRRLIENLGLFPARVLHGDVRVYTAAREYRQADCRSRRKEISQRQREIMELRRLPSRGPQQRDRKSTRLNSSHVSISYAVFCLKKK